MKTFFSIILITASYLGFAQIIIGDNVGTATDTSSVLLDFAANQDCGIILPWVTTLPTVSQVEEGTFILDASDPTHAKVKFYNGSWVDLSSNYTADISSYIIDQPTANENPNAKVVIGADTSTAEGILVLESQTKAMILPMVESIYDVMEPAPGMMVYTNDGTKKRLALFNGVSWTFWKPANAL